MGLYYRLHVADLVDGEREYPAGFEEACDHVVTGPAEEPRSKGWWGLVGAESSLRSDSQQGLRYFIYGD